jgi:hypothetical protein
MNGLTVYNGNDIQFSTKYPALLVDRTNNYGYKNYQVTFQADLALPPTPTSTNQNPYIYIPLLSVHHGLGRIPAFESVTIGYGLTAPPYGGIGLWNEDALLDWTSTPFNSTNVCNKLLFRANTQDLLVYMYRQSGYNPYSSPATIFTPPSLAGVQLNINTQIFAMGLNDISSQVQ